MKTSNKLYLLFGAAILALFIANIVYHIHNYNHRYPSLGAEGMFYRMHDSIKIVSITGHDKEIVELLKFDTENQLLNYKNYTAQKRRNIYFYQTLLLTWKTPLSDDTLYVMNPQIAHFRDTMYFKLENVEKVYFNGELVKTYSKKQKS